MNSVKMGGGNVAGRLKTRWRGTWTCRGDAIRCAARVKRQAGDRRRRGRGGGQGEDDEEEDAAVLPIKT